MKECRTIDLGRIAYGEAAALQQRLVAARKNGAAPDLLLFCEHPHVVTLGRSGKREHLRVSEDLLRLKGVEFHHTNRGGDITYHGPGQIVGYPVLDLNGIRRDVAWYVRRLEDSMIRATSSFGIHAFRVPGRTGVWVEGNAGGDAGSAREEKLAAIGVHISRWVTSHGFAYNVSTDLRFFDLITPCGIAGCRATSLENLLGVAVSRADAIARLSGGFSEAFGRELVPVDAAELSGWLAGEAEAAGCRDPEHRHGDSAGGAAMKIKGELMKSDPARQELTHQEALELYYYMRLNRSLDELLVRLFRQNKIVGGLYGSLGQEATSVATAYALAKGDWIAPLIRNVGSLLVHGYKPRDIMTQYMARVTSPTQGKDGTCHFGDLKTHHVVSPISMLGDLIPVMTGVAMAGRYLGQKIVAMTWIGDGGTSTGAFHEGMNLAAVQRAPLVVVLENNQWAYSTPVNRQASLRDFSDRARAYGIASYSVDGNDLVAVLRIAREAVERARQGHGPVLIESKTMRMLGHAQHDPAEYVPREMFEYWKARDPLGRYEKYLDQHKLWNEKEKAAINARVERELAADLEFAENSAFPPPELAEQGVYCQGCHSIEADWRRAKEELMPPKSGVKAEWTIKNFGGVDSEDVLAPDRPDRPHRKDGQDSTVEPAVAQPAQTDRKRKIPAPAARRARR